MLVFSAIVAIAGLIGLYMILSGPLYVPIDREALETAIAFLRIEPGRKYVDLGSGDGRTLVAIARKGGEAHGYEFNPLLVLISRWKIRREGLSGAAFVHFKDFWPADVSACSGVVVFGATHIMARLERKLSRELKPGTPVASHVFRLPTLKHVEHANRIYLYRI